MTKGSTHTSETIAKISLSKRGVPNILKRIKVDEKSICEDYKKGESALTLEQKYPVSYKTIYGILKRNNITRRNNREKTLNAFQQGRNTHSVKWFQTMKSRWSGENNPRWSGGWYEDKHGYKWIHDDKGRWKKEHRVVVERIIGRDLLSTETIHHMDENKRNNNPSNLYYFQNDNLHKRHHGLKIKPNLTSNLYSITGF